MRPEGAADGCDDSAAGDGVEATALLRGVVVVFPSGEPHLASLGEDGGWVDTQEGDEVGDLWLLEISEVQVELLDVWEEGEQVEDLVG